MGSVYRPKLKNGQLQSTYRITYSVNGKKVIESTGLTDEREARRVLKEREGRVATGQPILPRVDKVRYEEIRDDLSRYYAATQARELGEVGKRLAHLDKFFGSLRVIAIDRSTILRYIEARQAQGGDAASGLLRAGAVRVGAEAAVPGSPGRRQHRVHVRLADAERGARPLPAPCRSRSRNADPGAEH